MPKCGGNATLVGASACLIHSFFLARRTDLYLKIYRQYLDK